MPSNSDKGFFAENLELELSASEWALSLVTVMNAFNLSDLKISSKAALIKPVGLIQFSTNSCET